MFVSTANIKLKAPNARKLLPWRIGSTLITKIRVVAYCVQLPITCKIHNVFRVSILQPYTIDGTV